MCDAAGQLLDGCSRLKAYALVGIEPRFQTFNGSDPVAYIIVANLKHRHLNQSQRAMVAAKLATIPHVSDRRSDQAANLQLETKMPQAAVMLNVSERLPASAAAVRRCGNPELIRKVEAGEVSVSGAAKQVQPRRSRNRGRKSPADSPVVSIVANIRAAVNRLEKAAAAGRPCRH